MGLDPGSKARSINKEEFLDRSGNKSRGPKMSPRGWGRLKDGLESGPMSSACSSFFLLFDAATNKNILGKRERSWGRKYLA